jgi:Winged helix-turn helix
VRAILLSLSGWKSATIGEVFGVREDTVRDWRSAFMREGLVGIERHPAPGRSPVKPEAALAVANELFAAPVERDQLDLAAPAGGSRAAHWA